LKNKNTKHIVKLLHKKHVNVIISNSFNALKVRTKEETIDKNRRGENQWKKSI